MALYLADSSIWAWSRKPERPDIRQKLAERFAAGEVATCVPVVLEAMHRARTGKEYEQTMEELFEPLEWIPLGESHSLRALDVQRELAAGTHGNHLRPAIDYLIAAIAEAAANEEIVLWFFDKDLRVICEHTGQAFEAEESTGPGH